MSPFPRLLRAVSRWMVGNTVVSVDHLTPSLRLRLITAQCPLWMATPEQCPYDDPYWAFYWPGGQAVTKYIMEHPSIVHGKRVLDFGAGCGASSVASITNGARHVIVNDIDRVALCAVLVNAKLNGISCDDRRLRLTDVDVMSDASIANELDTVIVGDMFYDSEFGGRLYDWLRSLLYTNPALHVVIGDPKRHALPTGADMKIVEEYALPAYVTREHYGYSSARIIKMEI